MTDLAALRAVRHRLWLAAYEEAEADARAEELRRDTAACDAAHEAMERDADADQP